MSHFTIDLEDKADLVLREPWTVDGMHALITKNLDRLRNWESWAQGEQTRDGLECFTNHQLSEWVAGRSLPAAIRQNGALVGSVGARIDLYAGVADLGYWIDADQEGRGLVTQASRAVIDHLRNDRGLRRIEIRAAVGNTRSRAVAERLGFEFEGTLRRAQQVGETVHDVALYALT
ncbi:GNAT family N-acetyltransferase [Paenarthrobacter aurescens]|uniref:GNAT family N-acetyltransferase n=1 Tax=Paenarthrobacter aurescens TaxID=43663 RepID=UPI0002F69E88|nr:GNAT family protein [Paenarthrobacter aurescens]